MGIRDRWGLHRDRLGQRVSTRDNRDKADLEHVSTEAHSLLLPLGIREFVKIMPKNIIIVGGSKSSGKTAFLLNTAHMNRGRKEGVYYYNSEMAAEELRVRIDEFEHPFQEWTKIHFKERSGNFADLIRQHPDAVHIIDFIEMSDEFYKIGFYIREIHDALGKGVAIIAIQKNVGTDYALGGQRSIEKARLVLALDHGVMKIVDAKIFARKGINPRGLIMKYKLLGGCKYFPEPEGWHNPLDFK